MKASIRTASLFGYLGALLLIVSYFPALDNILDTSRALHAIWHVAVFVAAGLFVYSIEALRRYAMLSRR